MGVDAEFLTSICENPEDDTTRLIYADWLEERGDPRGEFIRVQIELANMTADSPRRRERAYQAHQLLEKHGKEWASALSPHVEEWHFRRGFIDRITISAKSLIEQGERIFRLAPIERILVSGGDGNSAFLSSLPPWAAIRSLDLIANDLRADVVLEMASNPALRQLKRLVLCLNPIGDKGAAILCEEPFFQSLELLQYGGNSFSPEWITLISNQFGNRITFGYQREADHLYTFGMNGWDYWEAGLGKEFTQILLLWGYRYLETIFFDFEGNLIESQTTELGERNWDQEVAARLKELGIVNTAVHVKRFITKEGEELRDGESYWFETFDESGEGAEENRQGVLRYIREVWLPEGNFGYTSGNSPWIDKNGDIVAT